MSSHDHAAMPLGPGRLRVTATYCAYREHGRTAATMFAYGHLHGWLTGALRTTVDGQRWVNIRVPGTRRLRRFAGGAAEALVLFAAVLAVTSTVTIHLRGIATSIAIVIGVGVLLADAAIAIRYQWLRRRCEPPPPPPPRCAVVTNLAKDADATLADALALKRTWSSGSTATTWPCASKPDPGSCRSTCGSSPTCAKSGQPRPCSAMRP